MSDPQKANEFKAKGNQAFKSKNYQEAVNYFTQAIQFNPNDHVFYSNRSNSYVNLKQYAKALQDAEQCIKLNPVWPRGYQRKGTALFYQQKLDQSIETYKEGLKHEPENQGLKNALKAAEDKLAESMNSMGMNQAYLQAMMKLINHPQTKDFIQDPTFMQKVQALVQNPGLYPQFANDPKMKKAFEVISSADSPDFQNFMKNMNQNLPKKAPKQQQNPNKPSPPPQQQKKKQQPVKKEQTKMQPEDPAQNVKNRGNVQFKNKNYKGAIELYEEAIQLKPQQVLYYNNKAAAYIQMGDYDQANVELDRAEKLIDEGTVKNFTKKAKVYARRGSVLAKQQKYEESIKYYEKSLIEDGVQKVRDQLKIIKKSLKEKVDKQYLNPEQGEKACQAGNAFFKQGKYPLALKQYEDAIKRNPECAKYYNNLGTVYIKLMEWARAKDNFEICLKKDPQYIKAYGKKGDCHFAMKQYHKALEVFETGLKKDPNNQICKAGLQKTQKAIYMSNSQQTPEQQQQRAQRAMNDPQIQQILNTPEVRNALNDLQSDPKAIQKIMKNPTLAQKIDKLIQAGVIGMG